MGSITIQDLSVALSFFAGIIVSGGIIGKWMKSWLEKIFEKQMDTFKDEIEEITTRLDRVDIEACKNFLVRCLSDVERGEPMAETEKERFYEQYEHYVSSGGNSYIKQKVEHLKQEGKL